MSFTVEQVKSTVQMLIENGYHPVPVFISKKTGKPVPAPYLNPETDVYGIDHECWNQELPAIAVVLGRSRTLLLDWDYRKKRELESAIYRATVECDPELPRLKHQQQTAQWTDLSALAAVLGGDALQEPYQTNPPHHDSFHYMFRLPEGVEPGDLKCAATDWLPNVDIKQNIALAYIKPDKVLTDEEIPAVSTLQVAPQPLIDALTKSSEAASRDFTRFDGAPEDFEEGVEILNHISADKYEQGQIPRDVWIMCLAGWCSKFGLGPDSQDVLIAWSRRDEAGFSHDLGDSWVIDQAESVSGPGGVTWNSVCDEAKKFGYDLNASAKRKAAKRRERESREAVESSPNVTPLRAVSQEAGELWQTVDPSERSVTFKHDDVLLPGGQSTIGNLEYVESVLERLDASDRFFSRSGAILYVDDGCYDPMFDEQNEVQLKVMKAEEFMTASESVGTRPVKYVKALKRNEVPTAHETDGGFCEYDYDEGWVKVNTVMLEKHAKLVCASGHVVRKMLRPISIISQAPVLSLQNGKCVLAHSGYTPVNGGIYVSGSSEGYEPMDPKRAADLLLDVFSDFHFEKPADKARALASVLTPTLVSAGIIKKAAPVTVFEKNVSQAGASYLAKLIGNMHGEVPAVIVKKEGGGPGGTDSSFMAAWLKGERFILFDNVRGSVDSSKLEAAITSPDKVEVRIPYQAEAYISIRGINTIISSNGFEPTRDLANRVNVSRIRKQPMSYEFKRYEEGDIEDHIKANVPMYMSAIYSIVADWVNSGMPRGDESGHNMREWAGIVGHIIPHYFDLPHPMEGHFEITQAQSRNEMRFARYVCLEAEQAGKLGIRLRAASLFELIEDNNEYQWPNRKPSEDDAPKEVGKIMKKVFAGKSSQVSEEVEIAGMKITRFPAKNHDYKETFEYVIEHINDEENAQEVMNHA